MKFLQKWKIFESKTEQTVSKNLIIEICVCMLLINNEFLDNLLNKGLKARYSEDSTVFLNDLKNMVMAKNRLCLGKFEENKCVEDSSYSKINRLFESISFDIEEDWGKLIKSKNISRNIIDKLLPDEKLTSEKISNVFWIGPNKDKEHNEDIVIELTSGQQFSMFLNKNVSLQKSASFNLFADELLGEDLNNLYDEENIRKWNKLCQEWIRVIYENSTKSMQLNIEKFIDPNRIGSIGYFDYFDIKHKDPKFKYLGEYFKEFEENILKFSDLMNLIWENKDIYFMDEQRATKEWYESKIIILNSKILEHLLTNSLRKNRLNDIQKSNDEFKVANGVVKMKLMKMIVDKLGSLERPIYYLSSNGDTFTQIPSRNFFRTNYDNLKIEFDYHVKFKIQEGEDENNDFKIKVKLSLDGSELLLMNIIVKFSGSEFSGKLGAKYKYEIPDNFNYMISKSNIDES